MPRKREQNKPNNHGCSASPIKEKPAKKLNTMQTEEPEQSSKVPLIDILAVEMEVDPKTNESSSNLDKGKQKEVLPPPNNSNKDTINLDDPLDASENIINIT